MKNFYGETITIEKNGNHKEISERLVSEDIFKLDICFLIISWIRHAFFLKKLDKLLIITLFFLFLYKKMKKNLM